VTLPAAIAVIGGRKRSRSR